MGLNFTNFAQTLCFTTLDPTPKGSNFCYQRDDFSGTKLFKLRRYCETLS